MRPDKKRQRLNRIFKEKHSHQIIYESRDQFGSIQVLDDGKIRSLHFDSVEKQSCFDPLQPELLTLSYTQSMMAGFLLNPKATRFLNVGLGGGSIPRFILHYFPACHIDVVELRKSVIDIACQFFVMKQDERLRLVVGDAYEFTTKHHDQNYDMIFVDAFGQDGIAEAVVNKDFFSNCHDLLSPGGVFSINLWSHPAGLYQKTIKRLQTVFDRQVFTLPVTDRTNKIAIGYKPTKAAMTVSIMKKRALVLRKKLHLDFPGLLKNLAKYNAAEFKNLIHRV